MSSASISSVPSDVEVLLPGISDFDLLGISGDCYIVSFSGGSNAADLDWMEQRVAEMMSKGGWTRVGENAGGIESFAHEAYDGEGELQGITSAIVMLYDIGGEATVLIQFS